MRAKLIKEKDGRFHLWLNIGTKDADHIASNEPLIGEWGRDLLKYKLSLKNCQAIERGYDLDELANEKYRDYPTAKKSETNPIWNKDSLAFTKRKAFKAGFQKALELMGDKKFTEKELTILFAYGHQIGMNDVLAIQSQYSPQPMPRPDSDKLRDELIQSIQQNEWEVEILDERDSEGRLILKRVV